MDADTPLPAGTIRNEVPRTRRHWVRIRVTNEQFDLGYFRTAEKAKAAYALANQFKQRAILKYEAELIATLKAFKKSVER